MPGRATVVPVHFSAFDTATKVSHCSLGIHVYLYIRPHSVHQAQQPSSASQGVKRTGQKKQTAAAAAKPAKATEISEKSAPVSGESGGKLVHRGREAVAKATKAQKEFESEAGTLGRIRHPNLVALRAYYLGLKGEKLLVFDYMPKGSLASFLHARGPETMIGWSTRMRIAMDVARGLSHLHTKEDMIHGDLNSTNILLDDDGTARIADYGLSRLTTAAAAATTTVATAGALGYAAPEVGRTKKGTAKSDVYSLGVVMLELLTGKSPSEGGTGKGGEGGRGGAGEELPRWVASVVKEEWTNEVFDLELLREGGEGEEGGGIADELLNTLKPALHCVDPSLSSRRDAEEVLRQLQEIKPPPAGMEMETETEEEKHDQPQPSPSAAS
ncbi:hypothetical protein MLD38_037815 [Melastoma candidum]|uniref:Uncharacterized protein n=1 Tax=Melastoma candidum TaxID=119954 RepID=A0ACB9LNT5_9MYRT|nr:hypothetical protein MLD38_037815 [Melastoma candidum]